jgi:hypothetical protein
MVSRICGWSLDFGEADIRLLGGCDSITLAAGIAQKWWRF